MELHQKGPSAMKNSRLQHLLANSCSQFCGMLKDMVLSDFMPVAQSLIMSGTMKHWERLKHNFDEFVLTWSRLPFNMTMLNCVTV
jgi:hypothetical protein